ncbi:MAG: nitronate monooxygenase [Pirellulaceae bacterium]|nr:nitronate monooxygenase [Pirellulaceae bacterium]
MVHRREPIIIQGGMGVAVSGWRLARAVSQTGQLGVVSGTALDVVLARRLQLGDPDGHLRRAMAEFPLPGVAQRILDRYFIDGGKRAEAPFRPIPVPSAHPTREQLDLLVMGNFVEVFLAREDHDGLIGVNFLEKIQLPTLPSLFGAMLAGVDYILMGAGIPRTIPGVLDSLSQGESVELAYHVTGAGPDEQHVTTFDPVAYCGGELPWLERPKFLAIISSATLATMLARKATGYVDGFVVEGPTAGGHNAPPRGNVQLNERGEPMYGPRDVPDLAAIAQLGRPFWLAGSYGDPQRVVEALEVGAAGVQVGTAFAYCHESGLDEEIRRQVIALSRAGRLDVKTDPLASPTGFPFKVVQLDGTISDDDVYVQRHRVCDLGYLRHAYKTPEGTIGWRCGSEDIDAYLRKGGDRSDTCGRKCICNGLLANIGIGQYRKDEGPEKPLVTSGDEVRDVARFLPSPDADGYSAEDVVAYLLSAVETGVVAAR